MKYEVNEQILGGELLAIKALSGKGMKETMMTTQERVQWYIEKGMTTEEAYHQAMEDEYYSE